MPLSNADHEDDRQYFTPSSRVTGDWSAHIATTLDRTGVMLSQLTPEEWDAPSLCTGWRVRDVAGHIIWRLGASNSEILKSGARAFLGRHINPNRAISDIAKKIGELPPEELIERIHGIADSKVRGIGRTGIQELTEAVVHTYDISEAIGHSIRLSPRSTGAVARARLRTSSAARAITRRFTLCATDARWKFGTGPVVEATAAQIIMHLFDRRDLELPNADEASR